MKNIIITIGLMVPIILYSQEWEPIGPDTLTVNKYFADNTTGWQFLCCDEGLVYSQSDTWSSYVVNLPVVDAAPLNDTSILVLMGNGSYSDGLYQFDIDNESLTLVDWFIRPNFIHYSGSQYFIGTQDGLYASDDGLAWDDYYDIMNVVDIVTNGQLWLVFIGENGTYIHKTTDGGSTWFWGQQFSTGVITDATIFNNDVYISIGGDETSSGLYKSSDMGDSYYKMSNMPHINVIFCFGDLFAGWNNPSGSNQGIAIWNSLSEDFDFFNQGLPNKNINHIGYNPYINCPNVIACTDQGAYMKCAPFINKQEIKGYEDDIFTVSPNPFSKEVRFGMNKNVHSPIHVKLYDITGKEKYVIVLSEKSDIQIVNRYLIHLQKGMYLLKVEMNGITQTRKIIKQ